MADLGKEIKKQKAKNRMLQKKGEPQKVYNLIKDDSVYDEPPTGEQFTVCSKCGETFEQVYSSSRNCYTSFRNCPACRKQIAKKKEEKIKKDEKEIAVATLPFEPFEWQQEVMDAFETHRFVVIACGNRCLPAGSFINGADKPIEDIRVGDKVIGISGKLQRVMERYQEEYDGDLYTIKGVGLEPIVCTDEHPIYVTSINKESRTIVDQRFVYAKNVQKYVDEQAQGNYVYLKMVRVKGSVKCDKWELERLEKNYVNQIDSIPINEDTAWMIGLYCAEGCYLDRAGCKFTLNYEEPELAQKLCGILDGLGLHYHVRERDEEGTRCVIITKMQICRKLDEEVGHGSLNKKIPYSILYNADENILIAFLKGYYAGDGYLNKNTRTLHATTVSKTLSQQLQTAWTRIGYFSKITSAQRDIKRFKKNGEAGVVSREYCVHVSTVDAIRLLGYEIEDKKERVTAIVTNDSIYTKLQTISVEKCKKTVYNFSTEDDTYCCFNTLIHNSGKDKASIMIGIKYFIECLNENRAIDDPMMVPPVLWWQLAPTEKMAKQNWRELKAYFPKQWIVAVSDSNFQMETVGGGIIEVRSGYASEDLVGVGLDFCSISEAARFKDLALAWANLEARLNSPGRGRKKDRAGHQYGQGKALINSSPIGKGDFYDLFCFGQKDHPNYSSNWWSCQYPWTCNPINKELADSIVKTRYGEMTYEESLRRQIGERTFRSNYLADFLAEDGTVFKNFEDNCVVNIFTGPDKIAPGERKAFIENWREPKPFANYVGGYDPATGSSSDSPAFVIRCTDDNRVVRVFDLYGKNYEQQWNFIAAMCKTYNYAPINFLRTGHTAIEGQFAKRGITENPLDEQAGNKAKLVQTLELAVENSDVKVLNDGTKETMTLIYQMNDYSENKGKYANDKQPHDDFVSAMYAAFADYSVDEPVIQYEHTMSGVSRYEDDYFSYIYD